ncbi:MAG TPA: protocatechuate 3,4-dioxygenase subunit alpha [Vicinamibacterales bacterium]
MSVSPFQTVGPFFEVMLRSRAPLQMVGPGTRGERVAIEGVLADGAGNPIPDALVEIWQADAAGRYAHPADPQHAAADPSFHGYGWRHTVDNGRFSFDTIKPGAVAGPAGRIQAPHILVSVMARGILTRFLTRLYFEDEPANDRDPILALVPAARRHTLIARRADDDHYIFDIRIQGPGETVFFDL